MSSVDTELAERLARFIDSYAKDDLVDAVQRWPKQPSITIDFEDLFQYDTRIADDLLAHPDKFLSQFDDALIDVPLPIDANEALRGLSVRVGPVPSREIHVDELASKHEGEYATLTGQVSRTSRIMVFPTTAAWECVYCGDITTLTCRHKIQKPSYCRVCEKQRRKWSIHHNGSTFVDRQVIRLREPPERARGSGDHIDVFLEGSDLVKVVDPGDRVKLSGVYRLAEDVDADDIGVPTWFDGRHIQIEETDYESIDVDRYRDEIESLVDGEKGDPFDVLINSFAPSIKGMETIKEAIICQMFGGTRVKRASEMDIRGDSHILLVGDPGTAKSSLLHAAEELAPRSVFASGKGLTKAGATAAAVRDDFGDEEWSLKAGALVLANKGLACIDEIDKVSPDARSSLHGALESQRVDVAKAGISATLPAVTAVLAAGNPDEGRFNPDRPAGEQVALGPTLLSRFDLIYAVSDVPDETEDHELATHILESTSREVAGVVDNELVRAWIALARETVDPVLEPGPVADDLADFWVGLRNAYSKDQGPVPLTPRSLEGLTRLAQSSARVRLSETVEREDVERATRLFMASMRDAEYDPETGQFDVDIVETGQPKSQRDRVRAIKSIIDTLAADADQDGAAIDDVVEQAVERGIDREKAEHEIDRLKTSGELYQPKTDRVATI